MAKEVPIFLRAEIGNDATDPTQEPQCIQLPFLDAVTNATAVIHLHHAPMPRCLALHGDI
jgi:hypothetical protein